LSRALQALPRISALDRFKGISRQAIGDRETALEIHLKAAFQDAATAMRRQSQHHCAAQSPW
jgi:hypothetical protein